MKSGHTPESEYVELLEWIRARWQPGCWLGDVAREPPLTITDDEFFAMEMAKEGWSACVEHYDIETRDLSRDD